MHFPAPLIQDEERCIVDSILRRQMVFITGYFGDNQRAVQRIAKATRAVLESPLVQVFKFPQSRLKFIPSYALMFGHFRQCLRPHPETSPSWREFQEHIHADSGPPRDLEALMQGLSKLPKWQYLGVGSAFVPNLGNTKHKPIDWNRWFPHVHQVPIWYGTAIPSRYSQRRQSSASSAPTAAPEPTLPQSRPIDAGEAEELPKPKRKRGKRKLSCDPTCAEVQPSIS